MGGEDKGSNVTLHGGHLAWSMSTTARNKKKPGPNKVEGKNSPKLCSDLSVHMYIQTQRHPYKYMYICTNHTKEQKSNT